MSQLHEAEDEDSECFYESLDRLVSSSSLSCSASNSDYDYDSDPTNLDSSPPVSSTTPSHDLGADTGRRRRNPFPVPRFPVETSRLDVWISEPTSVSERRSRLLREMGLSSDPVLLRSKPKSIDSSTTEIGVSSDISRSISPTPLTGRDHGECAASVGASVSCRVRSKSDGSASLSCYNIDDRDNRYPRCNSYSILASDSQICVPSKTNLACVNSHDILNIDNGDTSNLSGGSANTDPAMACEKTSESLRLNGNSGRDSLCVLRNPIDSVADEQVDLREKVCTIKNLDNGKEFVVNEIQEDGTCKRLREKGTGKQMTMEEFEMCVGHSPIVQELMRRQNVENADKNAMDTKENKGNCNATKIKKKGSWFKSIKSVASSMTGSISSSGSSSKERRSSDDRDTSSERGGRRSSSATDDSQDSSSFHGPERVRVKQYGKSCKDLTALYKTQEIQGHKGSIWSIEFSLDGKYLASAGEDCVIHIWRVIEGEKRGELLSDRSELLLLTNGSPETSSVSSPKRKGRASLNNRKSLSSENIKVPHSVFGLSEKPFCSFRGHLDDVLDLSWSKSQHLLSSSMDKTVRLWHLSSETCLKVFSHSDYVTCIQFNPVDDRYFISGSLDSKVRVWSIPDRQVVDWYDLHEMVTSACYTPDGQGALVGSYKGNCRVYSMSDYKMQQTSSINLQNKKKKAHHKKITGFQFVPGSSSEVLITSSDSRIRVADGADLVYKLKGFRNTNSQMSASITADGRYVVSGSEDSHVYVWKYEPASRPSRTTKGMTVTNSYEYFHCQDVSVAIPWPGMSVPDIWELQHTDNLDEASMANHPPTPVNEPVTLDHGPRNGIISGATNGYLFDRISATWPEEKLRCGTNQSRRTVGADMSNGVVNSGMSAWNMVIVTAGLRGEIRTFQNFGFPVRI